MAEGGLAALPIPDDMFDAGNEYAGGGIVAFNEGGKADKSPTQLEILRAMDPRQLQALIEEGGGLFSPTLVKQVLEEKQPEPPKRSIGPDIDLSPLPGMKPDSREPINLTAPVERLLRDTEKASSGVGAAYGEGLPQGLMASARASEPAFRTALAPARAMVDAAKTDAELLKRGAGEAWHGMGRAGNWLFGLGPYTGDQPKPEAAQAAQVPAQPAVLPDVFQIGAQGTVTPNAFVPPLRPQPREEAPVAPVAPGPQTTVATAPQGEALVAPVAPAQQETASAGLKELMKQRQDLLGPRVEPTYLTDLATDLEKQKKQDMWATLAQLGANIAAGQSPNFLTNVGAGLASAVPSAQKSLAERRAMQREIAKAQYGEQVAERAERGEDIKFASDQLSDQAKLAFEHKKMMQESGDRQRGQDINFKTAQVYAANSGIRQERVPDLVAIAYAYQKEDPTLTFEQAMSKATAAELATKPASGKPDASSRIFPGEDRPGVVRVDAMTEADLR
jgi:hypothetical protein